MWCEAVPEEKLWIGREESTEKEGGCPLPLFRGQELYLIMKRLIGQQWSLRCKCVSASQPSISTAKCVFSIFRLQRAYENCTKWLSRWPTTPWKGTEDTAGRWPGAIQHRCLPFKKKKRKPWQETGRSQFGNKQGAQDLCNFLSVDAERSYGVKETSTWKTNLLRDSIYTKPPSAFKVLELIVSWRATGRNNTYADFNFFPFLFPCHPLLITVWGKVEEKLLVQLSQYSHLSSCPVLLYQRKLLYHEKIWGKSGHFGK